ncbi:MAG: hypothetical protein QOF76_3341 [Solirubrobacteraceae bacterium]|jgi:hypothetical protein|nr:hypothetical protein [Solirubrobacteraceae bacterium]
MDPVPADLSQTRTALHAVALDRVSPARAAVTGRIDLRATAGGFGTPVFDGDREVRVDGATLVTVGRGVVDETTLDGVSDATARWLGRFYALALEALTEVARDLPREWAPSCPKIWPEHFDYAIEAGTVRANLGLSPGDEEHEGPYAYVGPWEAVEPGPLWNATGFTGAELPIDDLDGARDAVLSFFRERLDALHA